MTYRCIFCRFTVKADAVAYSVERHAICTACATVLARSARIDQTQAERVIRAAMRQHRGGG